MGVQEASATTYVWSCHKCNTPYDACEAVWCNCLIAERSLVCPSCLACFCKADKRLIERFWSEAPQEMWDRKVEEERRPFHFENPSVFSVNRPLVLIVEDDLQTRRVAATNVQSMGYGVLTACDGLEGLRLAREYMPDVVLSGALMPKLDGREMCRQLKSQSSTSRIRVAIMTAMYTQSRNRTEAYREFRVDDYLIKPIDFDQLYDLLKKHLRQQ